MEKKILTKKSPKVVLSSALRNRVVYRAPTDNVGVGEAHFHHIRMHDKPHTFVEANLIVEVKRLADPKNKEVIDRKIDSLSSTKADALAFLESIGVASSSGGLTKRYGGSA